MTGILARAEQLKQQVEAALGDLVDLVTLDGVGLKPSTRAAVMIPAPSITFPNFGERDTTWKIIAAAGPADRPMIALDALDAIMSKLEAEQFNFASADPMTLDLAGGGHLPAYELTLNPE